MFNKLLKNLKLLKEQSPHKKPVILVAFGNYNPIHKKHVLNLEYTKKEVEKDPNLKVVGGYLLPLSDKKIKNREICQNRIKMMELAVEDSNWIDVYQWILKQEEALGIIHNLDILTKLVAELVLDQVNNKLIRAGKIQEYRVAEITSVAVYGEDKWERLINMSKEGFEKYKRYNITMTWLDNDDINTRGLKVALVKVHDRKDWQKPYVEALNRNYGDKWKEKVLFIDSNAEVPEGSNKIRKLIKDGVEKNEAELSKLIHPKVLKYVKFKDDNQERERERDKKQLKTLNLRRSDCFWNFHFRINNGRLNLI